MISSLIVDLNNFDIKQTISERQYESVFLVENKDTKMKYTARTKKSNSNWVNEQTAFFSEIETFMKVKFPSIINLVGFNLSDFNNQPNPTILTDFTPNGSLKEILDKERNSSAPQGWNNTTKYIILLGICLGMKHLHSINIIHGDLKPFNILLNDNYYPQIFDFALSINKKAELVKLSMKSEPENPIYMAPEIINDEPYTNKADTYSFGLILYEILTNKRPLSPIDFKNVPNESNQTFLSLCLSQDPSKRPTFSEIIEFMQNTIFMQTFSELNESQISEYLHKFERYDNIDLEKSDPETIYNYGVNLFFGDGIEIDKKKAFECFKIASLKGNANAMFNYGRMLEKGESGVVSMNKEEACRFYKMSADKGNSKAMYNYALMLANGDGISMNKEEACHYYKLASEKGNSKAMFNYARLLENKEEIARYYKMAADHGNAKAMLNYGKLLETGEGVDQNKEESIIYIKKAADNGNSKAMLIYGQYLLKGQFVPQNLFEALRYIKMAADHGNAQAMFEYGLILYKGEITTMNKEEAIHYYKKSAEKGNSNAMNNYALMLARGEGIQSNKEEACHFFKKAAEKGNISAMINYCWIVDDDEINDSIGYLKIAAKKGSSSLINEFGKKLYNGIDGILMNKRKSAIFFKIAADHGNIDAMTNYATILYNGEGVKIDKKEANYYFKIAANKGNSNAMHHYSQALMKGDGVQMNKNEALCYLKMSADKGNPDAMFEYGMMLLNGDNDVLINKEEAAIYFKNAAEKGNINSMLNYGLMLQNGDGIQQDREEANRYFKMIEGK